MSDCKQVIKLEATFQDTNNLYYLMELATHGTLKDLIKKKTEKKIDLTQL